MLAPKSSHKRKRSSARSDKARKLGPTRWIVNLLPSGTPKSQRETKEGTVLSPQDHAGPSRNSEFDSLIDSHSFCRSLELIVPLTSEADHTSPDSAAELPAGVSSLLRRLERISSSHRSYRARIPLSLLLDPIFVTAYLKTGSLIALSHASGAPGLSPGLEDTACVDGQGTLVLSLCKDTYQTLGLTGRASHFSRLSSGRAADRTSGPDSRFIVELPLLSPSFVPGKKGYQQALDRLRQWDRTRAQSLEAEQTIAQSHASSRVGLSAHRTEAVTSEHATWDMLFVWSPSRETADSIAAEHSSASLLGAMNEISFPEDLVRAQDVECLSLQAINPVITDSVWIPPLNDPAQHPLGGKWRESERHFAELEPSREGSSASTWPAYQDGLQEAVEWAGLASLGANPLRTFTRPDSTCVYSPPLPSRPGRIVKLSWSGPVGQPLLLSPLLIAQIAAEVNDFVVESSGKSHHHESAESVHWATLSCSGFPHAPLTWRSKVPLSSIHGAKELPGNKTTSHNQAALPATEDASMTDTSSSDDDDDADNGDSDSSLDMDGLRTPKPRKKKRSKRNIGKNQTEHTFTPSTGLEDDGLIGRIEFGETRSRDDFALPYVNESDHFDDVSVFTSAGALDVIAKFLIEELHHGWSELSSSTSSNLPLTSPLLRPWYERCTRPYCTEADTLFVCIQGRFRKRATMGNDGGSIAKRDELVRTKASFEKVDPELLRQSLWTVCSLSRQPLQPPVASDQLGHLYNKDAILSHLLARHQSTSSSNSDPIPHVRGLRDITELNLTPNTLYRAPSPTSSSKDHSVYPFMCPLSSKQMDGNQRFVYIAACGCAMSYTGLRTTVAAAEASKEKPEQRPCPVCGKAFNAAGLVKAKQPEVGGSLVTINPGEAEQTEMREALDKARAEQAAKKKAKTRTADQATEKGKAQDSEIQEDRAERKRRKAERKAEVGARIAALTSELAAEQS
ncbi:hypothetical protein PHSY_005499 [Pseudozyma hubeiensis SY62]|uniref:Replication termination factor 2 n=1 Tax=Pseudozyma hubeiensis (strain SY62) TaxID=1305764 RepID=R9P976_PSEHS|nr:hypothetical protein PHSY_005499 [Pseudozyma hubeiensis SY62]GAC97911.1 hypothetical protein PHSY_005499 [Pseudozyma hubeiensis SY62]